MECKQEDFDEDLDKVFDETGETCSETDDNILCDDDNEFDDFDVEDLRDNRENFTYNLNDNRNFELGKDNETIWTDKPISSKFLKLQLQIQ